MKKNATKQLAAQPLTIQEAYENRPRLWWLYTMILLIVAALLGWSGTAVEYKGLATKGMEVADAIVNTKRDPWMDKPLEDQKIKSIRMK